MTSPPVDKDPSARWLLAMFLSGAGSIYLMLWAACVAICGGH